MGSQQQAALAAVGEARTQRQPPTAAPAQGSGGLQGRCPDVPKGSFVKPQVTQTSSMINPQDSLLNTSNPQEPSFDRDIYFDDDKSSMTRDLLQALVDGYVDLSTYSY
ncbi:hypothetical protein CGCFRS4_v016079 [Colletotrichum fructicola]|nr:hypothetical protein CGCFRS4_v016079 [Colletotrichum fructicola]